MSDYLLIDGDMLCYQAAYLCREGTIDDATVCLNAILDEGIMQPLAPFGYTGYLSGKGNFRDALAVTVPYKGNRAGKEKPAHLQGLKDYAISRLKWQVSDGQEADDDISIEHVRRGYQSIVVSQDKDFLQLLGRHWNPRKQELKTVTPAEAMMNFYRQVLVGDVSDNIPGIYGVGPVKADRILAGCTTPLECWRACISAYNDVLRVHEVAKLLWLRRYDGEIWRAPKEGDLYA